MACVTEDQKDEVASIRQAVIDQLVLDMNPHARNDGYHDKRFVIVERIEHRVTLDRELSSPYKVVGLSVAHEPTFTVVLRQSGQDPKDVAELWFDEHTGNVVRAMTKRNVAFQDVPRVIRAMAE